MVTYPGKGSLAALKDDLVRVEKVLDALLVGFAWSETPEGHDYWEAVYENLFKRQTMLEEKVRELQKKERAHETSTEEV